MADDDTKKKEEEEELTPVGPGVEEGDEEEEPEPPKKKKEEEEEGEDDSGDDDDGGEEEDRLGAGDDDDDEEGAKKKKKTRRQRQKEARDRDKRELNFLRNRLDVLERRESERDQRIGQGELVQVDTRINDLKSKIKLADQVISKAISSNDGDAYSEAQEIRDNLRDQLSMLNNAKQVMSHQRQPSQEADPRLVTNAQGWMRDHPWWDPNGLDEDSRVVSRLDAQLVNEGFDPTLPEYWKELTERTRKVLPHRYEEEEEDDDELETGGKKKKKKRSSKGPSFRTGGRERPLRKGEVYISPERKQAMIEAGVWEDPVLRQRYLRSYAKYDQEAAATNA